MAINENTMDDFFKDNTSTKNNTSTKSIKKLDDSYVNNTHIISGGTLNFKIYDDYYDISNTIDTALASDPNDFDNPSYNREELFKILGRNSEKILVKNDGGDTIFTIVTHVGGLSYSKEVPIYPGEIKIYYNVYEIKLRSPTAGTPYRVMEYYLCCNSNDSLTPIIPATSTIIKGTKTEITTIASQITASSTLIYKVVTIKVRSLGTGTYIAVGDATDQPFRLVNVGDSLDIDWTDNLNKVYVSTDAGNTGSIEYIGG